MEGRGRECFGVDLLRELRELPRQMEAKQGPPGGFFPDAGAGPSGLDYTMGELQQVVRGRKKLRALSLAVLRDAIAAAGRKPYIEMVLRFVVHFPLRKRLKVYTEDDTRPIALEEEVAKIMGALILRETDSWVASS